jgi:hypothetical protein
MQVGLCDCVAFVSRQMSECKQLHAVCSSRKPGLLPSRILDVSLEGSTLDVRLTTVNSDAIYGTDYVALSHCWGDGSTILTTTKVDNRRACSQHSIYGVA